MPNFRGTSYASYILVFRVTFVSCLSRVSPKGNTAQATRREFTSTTGTMILLLSIRSQPRGRASYFPYKIAVYFIILANILANRKELSLVPPQTYCVLVAMTGLK